MRHPFRNVAAGIACAIAGDTIALGSREAAAKWSSRLPFVARMTRLFCRTSSRDVAAGFRSDHTTIGRIPRESKAAEQKTLAVPIRLRFVRSLWHIDTRASDGCRRRSPGSLVEQAERSRHTKRLRASPSSPDSVLTSSFGGVRPARHHDLFANGFEKRLVGILLSDPLHLREPLEEVVHQDRIEVGVLPSPEECQRISLG